MCNEWELNIQNDEPQSNDIKYPSKKNNDVDDYLVDKRRDVIEESDSKELGKRAQGYSIFHERIRQGYIMMEILGPPRCKLFWTKYK